MIFHLQKTPDFGHFVTTICNIRSGDLAPKEVKKCVNVGSLRFEPFPRNAVFGN